MKAKSYYNAKALSVMLGVHYKTVLYWWKKGKLTDAMRSPITNEIRIPRQTVKKLLKQHGKAIKL